MLKGWSNPLSPLGRAGLVESVPHHISQEAIQVYFRADPAIVQRYLPEGLEPIEGGLGYAYVGRMLKVSTSNLQQTYDNPERTQYGEGLISFFVRYGDRVGQFMPFVWVDQDWSVTFGHFMGWGKKMGDVAMTKIHPVNPGMGEIGSGTKLRGIVSRYGQRILDLGITLERVEDDAAVPNFGDTIFTLRYFPSVGPEIPAVHQLGAMRLKGTQTTGVWSGRGSLAFGPSDNEELVELGQVEVTSAYAFGRGWTTDAVVEVLKDYTAGR